MRKQHGFTLIELLIVVAILGLLALIVVPNVSSFLVVGNLAAANTEAANVETGALAFYAETGNWPSSSGDLTPYLSGGTKAVYLLIDGQVTGTVSDTWSGIRWNPEFNKWVKD